MGLIECRMGMLQEKALGHKASLALQAGKQLPDSCLTDHDTDSY
jgi:hypothetical protein